LPVDHEITATDAAAVEDVRLLRRPQRHRPLPPLSYPLATLPLGPRSGVPGLLPVPGQLLHRPISQGPTPDSSSNLCSKPGPRGHRRPCGSPQRLHGPWSGLHRPRPLCPSRGPRPLPRETARRARSQGRPADLPGVASATSEW